MLKSKTFFNWGRNIQINPKKIVPKNYDELKKITYKKSFIIQGNQRSYGDVCLNRKILVSMKNFNKIKYFDRKNGIIEIESGMLLKNLLPIIIGKGWFVPITPGTKYVSLGGMIANNVHGKNINKNQIKHYVKEIKLLGLNKKIINCTEKKNKKIFYLTIGGYGLTGIILSVTLKLKKISSTYLDQKIIAFNNYEKFFSISNNTRNYEYSVFWIENFTEKKIQGLNYLAKHSKIKDKYLSNFKEREIGYINSFISKLIIKNYFFSRIIKFLYKNYKKYSYKKLTDFEEVFYPQDYFIDWNKVYGNSGFFEIQFLVPKKKFKKILAKIHFFFKKEKVFSPFVVIKKVNERGKYLNFCGSGYSISLDFGINKNFEKIKIFFNSIIKENKLRVNFSKDLIVDRTNAFNYPGFKTFKKEISLLNPQKKLNSIFSKRLKI